MPRLARGEYLDPTQMQVVHAVRAAGVSLWYRCAER